METVTPIVELPKYKIDEIQEKVEQTPPEHYDGYAFDGLYYNKLDS